MADQIRNPIKLTGEQIEQLRRTTQDGETNYAAGYDLIYGWAKSNPAAQQDGTVFWFEQARGINGDNSLSASFIRRHTDNGLDLADVPNSQRLDMQDLSNRIARGVTKDILANGEVAALPEILKKDISVALNDGHVRLGGWGGSFYYWDMPYKPDDYTGKGYPRHSDGSYKTVGDEIVRRGEVPLLLETSSRTVVQMQMHGELPIKDWNTALQTGWNAGLPMRYQAKSARARRRSQCQSTQSKPSVVYSTKSAKRCTRSNARPSLNFPIVRPMVRVSTRSVLCRIRAIRRRAITRCTTKSKRVWRGLIRRKGVLSIRVASDSR